MSNDGNLKLRRLRTLNLIATAFFTAQVVLILLLTEPVSLPVPGSYLTNAPGEGQYGSTELFSLRILGIERRPGWAMTCNGAR